MITTAQIAAAAAVLDAAAGLELIVAGRLDLDAAGRARAAVLADHVRGLRP